MIATFVLNLCNGLIKGLGAAMHIVILLLPASPLKALDNTLIKPYLGFINWCMPFGSMLAVFSAWLTCVAAWYIYQIVLRWGKVIE